MIDRRFAITTLITLALSAGLICLLFFRFGAYRQEPVPVAYRGEVRQFGADLLSPVALESVSLSDDGRRFIATSRETVGDDELRVLWLWEESLGFTKLVTLAESGSAPVISGDGRRAFVVGRLVGDNFRSERSLVMWEEGLGVAALQIKVKGNVTLQSDLTGNRLVAVASPGVEASATLRGLEIPGGFVFRLYPDSEQGRRNRVALGNERPFYEIMSFQDSALDGGAERFFPRRLGVGAKSLIVTDSAKAGGGSTIKREILPLPTVRFNYDFNRDGAADVVSFYGAGSAPFFRILHTNGFDGTTRSASAVRGALVAYRVGDPGSIPVVGDYNGDGLPDLATFLPNVGASTQYGSYDRNWKIYFSRPEHLGPGRYVASPTTSREIAWGYGDAVAVPGDYDGDGVTDPAVFVRPSAVWTVLFSGGGFNAWKAQLSLKNFGSDLQWGALGDRPIVGDFNGDGRDDPTVIRMPSDKPSDKSGDKSSDRPSDRPSVERYQWLIHITTHDGQVEGKTIKFGSPGDIPLVGKFRCDSRSIPAVYRPERQSWYIRRDKDEITEYRFGFLGGEPFVADFDGDGCDDLAIYTPKEFPFYHFYNWKLAEDLKQKDGYPDASGVLRYGAGDEPPAQVLLRQHQLRLDEYGPN